VSTFRVSRSNFSLPQCTYIPRINKIENKTYYTVGTVLKSNRKLLETEAKLTLLHKYMTAHFPGLA